MLNAEGCGFWSAVAGDGPQDASSRNDIVGFLPGSSSSTHSLFSDAPFALSSPALDASFLLSCSILEYLFGFLPLAH